MEGKGDEGQFWLRIYDILKKDIKYYFEVQLNEALPLKQRNGQCWEIASFSPERKQRSFED